MSFFLCLFLFFKPLSFSFKGRSCCFLQSNSFSVLFFYFYFLSFYCSYDFDCCIWFLVASSSFIFLEDFDTKPKKKPHHMHEYDVRVAQYGPYWHHTINNLPLRARLVHCNDYYMGIGISIIRNTLSWNVISIIIH